MGIEIKCLVAQSNLTLCNPMDCSPSGSSVHEISQQGYWNGLPFPSPENFSHPEIKPKSPVLQENLLPLRHLGSPEDRNYYLAKLS